MCLNVPLKYIKISSKFFLFFLPSLFWGAGGDRLTDISSPTDSKYFSMVTWTWVSPSPIEHHVDIFYNFTSVLLCINFHLFDYFLQKSFQGEPLLANSIYMPENIIIPLYLSDNLVGYKILDLRIFSLNSLDILLHCFSYLIVAID